MDAPGDELALGRQCGECLGSAEMDEGFGEAPEFGRERTPDGVEEVVGFKGAAGSDFGDCIEASLGAVDARIVGTASRK